MILRRSSIPSTSALIAFESAARHCNFSRAAEELHTSQSAISRHIAELEALLGTRLFERARKKLYLTRQGQEFQRSVTSALNTIQTSAAAIAESEQDELLTIACSHEMSHLFLMPRFEALQNELGEQVQIRVMTYEYDAVNNPIDPRVDIILGCQKTSEANQQGRMVLPEAIQPVCSPEFFHRHQELLHGSPKEWSPLTFLQLTKQNQGWATWTDWFNAQDISDVSTTFVRVENYVYLLEAAATGRGLALGWRGMIERHIEAGSLVEVTGSYMTFNRGLELSLTKNGRNRPCVSRCEKLLAEAAFVNAGTTPSSTAACH